MIAKSGLKFIVSLILAASATAGLYVWEQNRAEIAESTAALRWSRQVIAQAEGMELAARDQGEKDPLSWAIDTLTQGVEPRLMLLRRMAGNGSASQPSETFQYDRKSGHFDYSRVLNFENGSGIRVMLDLKSAGIAQHFLGSQSQITEDGMIGSVLMGVFLLFWNLLSLVWGNHSEALPELVPLTPAPTDWNIHAKASVSALGIEIRDLLKQTFSLATTVRTLETTHEGMRERMRVNLNGLHSHRKLLKNVSQMVGQAEAVVKTSSGENTLKQVHVLLEKIKTLSLENEKLFRELEVQIEPCVADADQAAQAYQDALGATQQINDNIRKTKEKLAQHIRVLQEPKAS